MEATNSVLFQILKEPFFDRLRTQEQLGYIVQCSTFMIRKVLHGKFVVQSSIKGPDALIERINSFLIYARDHKIKDLTDEDVETTKKALIKLLEQKDLKLSDEVGRRWVAITDDSGIVDFDKREKKIKALEQVTKEQVQKWFNKLIFDETRRINIKMYS